MKQNNIVTLNLNGSRKAWMGAFMGTLGLNIALFAMIPILMHPSTAPKAFDTLISQINIVRIKRREAPLEKKPPLPMPETRQQTPRPKPEMNKSFSRRLVLPFKINTRLPGGPGTLALPEFTPGALDSLDLANLFNMGDLDQPLMSLMRLPPIYPVNAKIRGIQGWVKVRFIVTEQGDVDEITIITAEPQKIFNASVVQCVSAWRFKPGNIDGIPVKTKVETTIRFELN